MYYTAEEVPAKGLQWIVKFFSSEAISDYVLKLDGKIINNLKGWTLENAQRVACILNIQASGFISKKSIPIPVYESPESEGLLAGTIEVMNVKLESIGFADKTKSFLEYDAYGNRVNVNVNDERQKIDIIGSFDSDMRLSIYKSRIFNENLIRRPRTISFSNFEDEDEV